MFNAAGGRIFRFVLYKPGYCVCAHAPVFSVLRNYLFKDKDVICFVRAKQY